MFLSVLSALFLVVQSVRPISTADEAYALLDEYEIKLNDPLVIEKLSKSEPKFLPKAKLKDFDSQEITEIAAALQSLPDLLKEFIPGLSLLRARSWSEEAVKEYGFSATGYNFPNEHAFVLYDEYDILIIPHEIGHIVWWKLPVEGRNAYQSIGWSQDPATGKLVLQREEEFVTSYAKRDPLEDFAESIMIYSKDPQKLERVSPERFRFIENDLPQYLQ